MNTFKKFLFSRFKIISLLTLSITFSIFILILRIKLTHSFFLIFLVWNLFLAFIPFAITFLLASKTRISKFSLSIWFLIWLLFLPNAPYIVTDLIHLNISSNNLIWLDTLIIMSFACNGLVLFYLSVAEMLNLTKEYYKKKHQNYIIVTLFSLSAFGIYLGRFLRYNSWEIIQNPLELGLDIISIIILPKSHLGAWAFTLSFTLLLSFLFIIFKKTLKITL